MHAARPSTPGSKTARFGLFEADLASRELRKQDRKLRLQEQPLSFRFLCNYRFALRGQICALFEALR